LGYQSIGRMMGLEWILGRLAGGYRVDPVSSGSGPVVVSCKYGDESVGSGTTELVSRCRRYRLFIYVISTCTCDEHSEAMKLYM
jgi:hypothetical protein